jgi:hypothetical protein
MNADVVDAINDLTRVTLALHPGYTSKADAVRRLSELGIPAGRIAGLLGMNSKDVSSLVTKLKKLPKRRSNG